MPYIPKDDLNRDPAESAHEAERKAGRPGDKPYSGVLDQPIVVDWKKDDFISNFPVDFEKKVTALFDHFEVQHGNFAGLAFALANRHVPGFRFQKPAGAHESWSLSKQARLLLAVHRYRDGKHGGGASVSAACRDIAAAGTFGNALAGTLERQYYTAVKNDNFLRFSAYIKGLEDSGEIVVRDELTKFILDTFLRE